jgi:hypothetical protein
MADDARTHLEYQAGCDKIRRIENEKAAQGRPMSGDVSRIPDVTRANGSSLI